MTWVSGFGMTRVGDEMERWLKMDELAQLEAEIQQGMAELREMLR